MGGREIYFLFFFVGGWVGGWAYLFFVAFVFFLYQCGRGEESTVVAQGAACGWVGEWVSLGTGGWVEKAWVGGGVSQGRGVGG